MIEKGNLQLIPREPTYPATVPRDKQGLEPVLGVSLPDSWPVFTRATPDIYEKPTSDPSAVGWWSYLFVHVRDGALAGDRGFKGPPDESNAVEIGYAMVPEYRGRATEAGTLPDGRGSIGILGKLGTRFVGSADRVLRWRRDRRDFIEGGMH